MAGARNGLGRESVIAPPSGASHLRSEFRISIHRVTVAPAVGVRLALPCAPTAPQFSPDDVDYTVRTGRYIPRGCQRAARHARASTARTELLASRPGDRM